MKNTDRWVHVVQESRENGGGLVVMARGTKADMEKCVRKGGGMALPEANPQKERCIK